MTVNELHRRALRLTRLAQARQLKEAALNGDSLAMLAAEYQGAVMGIRNMQYTKYSETSHEAQLFDNERAASLMQKHLGYTYPDVVAVRRAIGEVSSQRMTDLRDGTSDIMLRKPGHSAGTGISRSGGGVHVADSCADVPAGRTGHDFRTRRRDGGRC